MYLKDTLDIIKDVTSRQPCYQTQEMVLMTNLLSIGISNMMGDSNQAILHLKNLFSFVEHVRFGHDMNANPDGILHYKELLGILLFMDSTTVGFSEIKHRYKRSYAIPVHQYASFTSISEVNISYQNIMELQLQNVDLSKVTPEEAIMFKINLYASFSKRLLDFERKTVLSESDREYSSVIWMHISIYVNMH